MNYQDLRIRNQRIIDQFLSGKDVTDIAKKLSLTPKYTRKILRDNHHFPVKVKPATQLKDNGYDPETSYPLSDVKVHTDNVYAYRNGYVLDNMSKGWNNTNGIEQRPFGAQKVGAKK